MKVMMVGLLPADLREVRGGVVSVILNLLEGFRAYPDAEVIHVSFNQEIDQPFRIKLAGNIAVHYIPFQSGFALIDYLLNRRVLEEIYEKEKPDVIHIQEVTPHLLRFLGWPKERIAVTQHGIMQAEFRSAAGWKNKVKTLFKGLVEKHFFPQFQNIIFISDYNKNLFPGEARNAARIFNPVNPAFFDIPEKTSGPHRILYTGVLNSNKNIVLLIRAIGLLREMGREFRVDVAGGYKDPAYRSVVDAQLRLSRCSDLFNFHGWKSQHELLALHERAGILVLPSLQENMPVCIAEAMAAGTLVVASDVGAISEMFTDGESGMLFPPDDLGALCFILKTLFDNPGQMIPMTRLARLEAQEKFNPQQVAGKTLDFYRQLAGHNHHP